MAGTSFWTVWTSPAYGGSGSRPLGLLLQARSRVFSCAAFSCTNASAGPMAGFRPQPGALWLPWRTRHQAPALPQGPFLPAPISSASGMAGPRLVKILEGPAGQQFAPATCPASLITHSSPNALQHGFFGRRVQKYKRVAKPLIVTLSMRMNSVTARARVLEFVCIFGHDASHPDIPSGI